MSRRIPCASARELIPFYRDAGLNGIADFIEYIEYDENVRDAAAALLGPGLLKVMCEERSVLGEELFTWQGTELEPMIPLRVLEIVSRRVPSPHAEYINEVWEDLWVLDRELGRLPGLISRAEKHKYSDDPSVHKPEHVTVPVH